MTRHTVLVGNGNDMADVGDRSVNLIVTSPPYPMIEMWDDVFSNQNPAVADCLERGDGQGAFQGMHGLLNSVWRECDRVLADNGFVCINIGDATRTIGGNFQLYPNHVNVIEYFLGMGYSVLPDIHWRKPSNAPSKFMGSGMYPAGAYVTYEHEYILVFRKGGKRVFDGREKALRQKSAFFWEERNVWFSDLWDIKGTSQAIISAEPVRKRNASFPLEIPYRLVNMYSIEGDTVLDPFFGLGSTGVACMISNRNSIGVEIDSRIAGLALDNMDISVGFANRYIESRLRSHLGFIDALPENTKAKCYENKPHGFKVRTKQETAIEIERLSSVQRAGNAYVCLYAPFGSL